MTPAYIIVHHSLTKDQLVPDFAAIRDWQMREMVPPLTDIAYHGIAEFGAKGYIAIMGRPWDQDGAHCKQAQMNHMSLGLLLVGNFDSMVPPDAQMEVARDRFLLPWMRLFRIPPQNIHPHRKYASYKTCPGRAFTGELMARFIPGIDLEAWR